MSKNYNQLSSEQRYQIEALIKAGIKQYEIANILKVSPSTICRELKRNTPRAGTGACQYRAGNAVRRTNLRHREKPKAKYFTPAMKNLCVELMETEKWSPEFICEMERRKDYFVSYETVYKWIWECKKKNRKKELEYKKTYLLLTHGCRRRKRGLKHDKRGNIPGRIHIEQRPAIVEKRKRIGDIEVDLMVGAHHKSALLIAIDRTTLLVRIRKVITRESDLVCNTLVAMMKEFKGWLKTFTFDNDTAFTNHEYVSDALNVDTYFTRPYTSQDKGTVENRIGILRRFIPKKTSLEPYTNKMIQDIENKINNRPIKKFNFKSANQVFSEKIALIS